MLLMEDNIFKVSVLVLLAAEIAMIFYCITLAGVLKRIDKANHQFPSWFVWLFLIPWVGFIFQWIMVPFGIPNTLKKTFSNDQNAVLSANTLFKLGLVQMILTMLGIFIPTIPHTQIACVLALVMWISYWVLIVKFKNKYLINQAQ